VHAIFSNSQATARKDIASLPAGGPPVDVVLTKSAQAMFSDARWPNLQNIFFQGCTAYSRLSIGRSVKLQPSRWSKALLLHLLRLCSDDGSVVLHLKDSPKRLETTLDQLNAMLGSAAKIEFEGGCAFLRSNKSKTEFGSVLDRLLIYPEEALFEYLSHELIPELAAHNVVRTAGQTMLSPSTYSGFESQLQRKKALPSAIEGINAHWLSGVSTEHRDYPEELRKAIGSLSYIYDGVGYKGWSIRQIVLEFASRRTRMRGADIGGAFGALALEMLLEEEPDFASFEVVDIKPKNASLCLNLTQMYRPKLNNKHLTFSVAKGDYKVMFTVDELDGLLNPFGEIKRFDPAKMAFVSKDEADNRSVFRAVVKD
jgi:hypothetical protein